MEEVAAHLKQILESVDRGSIGDTSETTKMEFTKTQF